MLRPVRVACLPEADLGDRFEWLAHLGSGGYGRVDLAFDRVRGQRVALKRLRAEHPDPSQLKREFRVLRDLAHKNLVTMLELVLEPTLECIVLEYVEGSDLLRYLGVGAAPSQTHTRTALVSEAAAAEPHSSPGRCDRGALVACLSQLVDALELLERHGWVHGDLKPENVLVDAEGRVVVLDFGIARLAGSKPARAVGTLAYMAPEQIDASDALTSAVDRYALGVLLYRALSGVLPFVGSASEVRAQQRSGAPALGAGTLEQLCRELMSEDPTRRPTFARVRAALGAEPRVPVATASSSGLHPRLPAPFVGRGRELERAMAALHASTAPILTVVAGPGLGKTTLLDRLVAASGRRALRSRCYANESIRWNAIDGLLDSLLAGGLRVDPDDDADLAALARLFLALSRRAAPPLADGAPLAERLRSAARGLLRLVERDGIELLIVDDVQWADADSMALLRELLALPSDLSVIIAMRGPDARSDAISEGLARSGRALERLELAPLDAEAISELWSALRPFEPVDLEHVLSATGGVPFLIEELARAELEIEGREAVLMNLLSVHDAPLDGALLQRASLIEPHALRRLVNERVLRVERAGAGRERFDLYHDVLRQRWLARLSTEARRAAHLTLADAMLDRGDGTADDIATHLLAANDERAPRYVGAAAEEAERVLAFDRAATWHLRRLSLPMADEEQLVVRGRLADCYRLNEHHVDAAQALEDLAARMPASPQRTELRRKAAEQWLTAGELERGGAVVRALDDEADFGLLIPNNRPLGLLAERVRVALALNAPGFVRRRPSRADLTRIDLAWTVSGCLALVDPLRAGAVHAVGLVHALEGGDPVRTLRALIGEVSYQGMYGSTNSELCDRLLSRIDETSRGLDDYAEALTRAAHGVVAVERGEFARGVQLLPVALRALTKHPKTVGWEIMPVRHFYMHALYYQGRYDELIEHVKAEHKEAEQRRNRHRMSDATLNHATVAWLLSDGAATARVRVDAANASWRGVGPNIQGYYALVSAIAIALFEGDLDGAWQLLLTRGRAALTPPIFVAEGLRIDFLHALARAALAGAHGRGRERALPLAVALTAALAREPAPYARALVKLQQAQLAGLLGSKRLEARLLERAARALEAAGLHGYARAARAVLGPSPDSSQRDLFRVLLPRPG